MTGENKPKAILETQWRMHPEIGNLMADVYYPTMKNGNDAELRATRRHAFKDPHELENQPLVWINTRTTKEDRLTRERPVAGGGYVNHYESRSSGTSLNACNRASRSLIASYS